MPTIWVYREKGKCRKKPWCVSWNDRPGHKVRTYHKSESAAEEKASELKRLFKAQTAPEDVRQFAALKMLAAAAGREGINGADVTAIFRAGLDAVAQQKAAGTQAHKTIKDLTPDFLKSRKAANCRAQTVKSYKRILAVMERMFPGDLRDLTQKQVEDALNARPLARKSRTTYARHFAAFLKWTGINPNPAQGLRFPFEDEKAIEYFTRDEVLFLMRVARPADRGQLALAIFAGIRPEATELMRPSDIVLDESITIRPEVDKTRSGDRLGNIAEGVEGGLYSTVWEWLRAYPFEPQSWTRLRDRLSRRLEAAGMKWKQDGARHSCATHYYALRGLASTARLLNHKGYNLVRKHYANAISVEKGRAFFALRPADLGPGAIQTNELRRKKITWPSDEELTKLIVRKPLVRVAKDLGVSDVALSKHCRLCNIPTMGRGHWTKVRCSGKRVTAPPAQNPAQP